MFKIGQIVRIITYPNIGDLPEGSLAQVRRIRFDGNIGVMSMIEGYNNGHNLEGTLIGDDQFKGKYLRVTDIQTLNDNLNKSIEHSVKSNGFATIRIQSEEFGGVIDKHAYLCNENGKDIAIYWENDKQRITIDYKITCNQEFPCPGIKIKIISCEKSIDIFGASKKREKFKGQIFHLRAAKKGTSSRVEGYINIYYLKTSEGGELKMLAEDCEIQYPKIKGYNAPKDRTIKVGTKVRYKNHKYSKYPKGELFEVIKVTIREEDRKMIVQLKDNGNKIITEYGRKFKVK